ncbi:MAG: hypothetical protein ACRDOU_16090 [Streptosporangiaceae bacterium]
MAKMLVLMMCPVGIAVALLVRYARVVPAGPGVRDDAPVRLLRWAVGLLSAGRAEWGQAMLGELDHIEGRGRRWSFAVGCAGAALLLPPWGRRAGAAVWAMAAVAIGAADLYASVVVRYRLGTGDWGFSVIMVVFLAGFTLAAVTLLRRPGLVLPGLAGGLVVVLAWLAMREFTFYGALAPMTAPFTPLVPMVAVPVLVGVAGTLWAGSAAAGRRIARLAAISAGLGLYLFGTIAVVVLGAAGPPEDSGMTVSYIISDRLSSIMIENLAAIPLVTATIGWAAAAATARLRPRLAASAVSVAFTAAGPPGEPSRDAVTAPYEARPAAGTRSWRRTVWLLLLCAGVAAAVFLAAASGLRG